MSKHWKNINKDLNSSDPVLNRINGCPVDFYQSDGWGVFFFWLLKMQRNKKCIQPPDFQSSPCICSSSPFQQMIEDCKHRMWRTAAPAGIFEIIIQVVAAPWALKGIWSNNSVVVFVLLYFSVSVRKSCFLENVSMFFLLFSVCHFVWKALISSLHFFLEHNPI